MKGRVLLLRHGETALNRSGALRGRLDVPLSEHGADEARRLARRIVAEYPVAALYSSPLRRAQETAAPIADATGLNVVIDERFTDVDYGPWAGRPSGAFSATERAEHRRWLRAPDVPLAGAEHPADVQRRAVAALAAHGQSDIGCIAIVTHDAVLQLVVCHVLRLELRNYRAIAQHTAVLNDLKWSDGAWHVHLLNSAWHLDGDDDV
jgi:broad specificity phosphatase PhoE